MVTFFPGSFLPGSFLPGSFFPRPTILWLYLLSKRTQLSQQLGELFKQYKTDILSITVLGRTLVMINDYDLVKVLFQNRTDATDRQDNAPFIMFDEKYTGVILTSGERWREVRRFSISMLRDFGMGRIGAEEQIQDESRILCNLTKEQHGESFDPKVVFRKKYQTMLSAYRRFSNFVQESIKEHRLAYNGEVTDFIYDYLKEMKQGANPEIFDDKMLESLIIDFFFAGSETTYTTLRWDLLAMAAYPEIQLKVQTELDAKIGNGDVIMKDKKNTVYTEAVLCEIQRHYTLVPTGPAVIKVAILK
jgi:cytochrome P450